MAHQDICNQHNATGYPQQAEHIKRLTALDGDFLACNEYRARAGTAAGNKLGAGSGSCLLFLTRCSAVAPEYV